jgi:signal transduction histidine kinase
MLFASILLVILPAAILAYLLRREMESSLEETYRQLVSGHVSAIQSSYEARDKDLQQKMMGLRDQIRADNEFYSAAAAPATSDRTWLLDYATPKMQRWGLDMLQIEDSSDRIVSSGHFRNNFDNVDPLPRALMSAGDRPTLVMTHTPERSFFTIVRADTFTLLSETYSLVGGLEVDSDYLSALSPNDSLAVTLHTSGRVISSDRVIAQLLGKAGSAPEAESLLVHSGYFVESFTAPMLAQASQEAPEQSGLFIVSYPLAPLRARTRELELALWLVLLATAAGTLLLAAWLSARVTGPIVRLARKTAGISLDHLDADFSSERTDEVGVLSRFLEQMTRRLRGSVGQLREAENRATLGELARQVVHDIRNGFTPMRNVIRHLSEVAHDPDELARVFRERHHTLETSLAHLEDLATHYARISPNPANERVQVNDIIRQVVIPGISWGHMEIHLDLARDLPVVVADRTGVRRILENLVRNARESLDGGHGTVTIATRAGVDDENRTVVILSVRDTGCGIAETDLGRVFNHFYTSKPGGTGLGLSIVQRIVSDIHGKVRVESALGRGSCFTVTLPAVPVHPGHTATRTASVPGPQGNEMPATDSAAPRPSPMNIRPLHYGEDPHS